MNTRPHQVIAALTLALACSAVLIGSAQADRRPDNRAGIRGIGSQSVDTSDVFTRAVARGQSGQAAVRPDDRAGMHGPGVIPAASTATVPDVFERAVLRHNAVAVPRPDDRAGFRGAWTEVTAAVPLATTESAGFQWADAAVGAAAALLLVLTLAGLASARTSHHRGHAAVLD
jgi:hypothetical protein